NRHATGFAPAYGTGALDAGIEARFRDIFEREVAVFCVGTGTAANDKTECAAVADVFGAHADALMMSSTKSMHGHAIGAAGALEAAACLMALGRGVVAPTINHEEHDPEAPEKEPGARFPKVVFAKRFGEAQVIPCEADQKRRGGREGEPRRQAFLPSSAAAPAHQIADHDAGA
ncbi:MAG: hypothetical protein AAFZ07_30140, partial [Actinomycetota bacterium]